MASLECRPDIDQVRQRMTTWWNGGDIGRPVMIVTADRVPSNQVPPRKHPPECIWGPFSTANLDYRVRLSQELCAGQWYFGEAMPVASLNFGPNALAAYIGARGVERPETFWVEPCIDDPESERFEVAEDNFYWRFTLELARRLREVGAGKFMIDFPDMIQGLDTLAAMRDNENLLIDLLERPEWVRRSLRLITDRWFYCYDRLYDLVRDDIGGSYGWLWGPGRCTTLQCDVSAMLSPRMFADFMLPVLTEMSQRVSYCVYHWDGVPQHHDALLSVPSIRVLQWSPPAGGHGSPRDKVWWPLYHKTIDAGKNVLINMGGGPDAIDHLKAFKREFGKKFCHFAITMYSWYLWEAKQWMAEMES